MSSRYTNVKLKISNSQKDKIKQALNAGTGVSIRITNENMDGEDVLALTQSQINKVAKAQQEGKGVTLNLSKTQVDYNMRIEGGFLPLLAGLASTVLPALATGALSGVASNLVGKLFNRGSGLYIKRGNGCCKATVMGEGLYLKPYHGNGLTSLGAGLYVKSDKGFVDGRGLLFGENSPFKNIPLLGWLL